MSVRKSGGRAEAEDTDLHDEHVVEVAGSRVVDDVDLVGDAQRDSGGLYASMRCASRRA